jgi:hypothetical protein
MQAMIIALLVGSLFWNIGTSQKDMRTRFGLFFLYALPLPFHLCLYLCLCLLTRCVIYDVMQCADVPNYGLSVFAPVSARATFELLYVTRCSVPCALPCHHSLTHSLLCADVQTGAGWYRAPAFYFSYILSKVPITVIVTFVFLCTSPPLCLCLCLCLFLSLIQSYAVM